MQNRFIESFNPRPTTQRKNSLFDKDKYRIFIENTNSDKLIAYKINKIQNDINNKSYNNIKRSFLRNKKDINDNILKNKNLKTSLTIDTNFFNDNHFIREFKNLFEQTTNNNIVDYFIGRDVEKMDDFVKTIKEYNFNNFIKDLKKKNNKNSKSYNSYKQRNFTELLYNNKYSPYTASQNEKNNYSEYASTMTSSTYRNYGDENKKIGKIMNNLGYELNNYNNFNSTKRKLHFNYDLIGNKSIRRINEKKSKFENEIKKLIDKNNKRHSFSYSKFNRNNHYNFII
jgi:hypothetical protein